MNLLQKAIYTIRRALTLTDPVGWRDGRTSSYAGESVTIESSLSLSTVWACVNLLAGTIGSLPLMVYRDTRQGGREVARDHPIYGLLHDSPNADQTAIDFWEFVVASLELWGNAYARIDRNGGGRIVALTPIRPDIVDVRRLVGGALQYRYTDDGRAYELRQDGIFHVRGFGGSPVGGLSTLAYGRHTFGLALATDRAAGSTFANGLRPSGLITFDKWLPEDKRVLTTDLITNKFAGAMNAGKPMILEGGMKWETVAINPEDAQMIQSRGFSVEDCCRFFGVPPHMVGHTEKATSWGTGLEQQTIGFQVFTLRRRLKRIEQAISKQLLTPVERATLTPEFNLEGLLRADSAARAAFYGSMTNIGAMTINEVRRLENLPPVEGGDVPRMQMQNVPITEAGKPPALPEPAGVTP